MTYPKKSIEKCTKCMSSENHVIYNNNKQNAINNKQITTIQTNY